MQRLRLGVLGEFGQGDLGRDAALVAFLQWVRRHVAHVEPVALFAPRERGNADLGIAVDAQASILNRSFASPEPPRAAQTPATLAGERTGSTEASAPRASRVDTASAARVVVALVRSWSRRLNCVRQFAGIVALGSGPADQLVDVAQALRLWSWARACRWAGRPFVMLSFAVPRTSGWFARLLLRAALRLAAYVSASDAASERWVAEARRGRPAGRSANPLFDLMFEPRWESAVDPWQGRTQPMKAGVTVLTYGVSPARLSAHDQASYQRYLGALARFCAATVRAGHRIVMFVTRPQSDRRAVLDLLARVPADVLYGVHVEEGTTSGDIARAVRGVRAVIATRYHGALWGLWAGRPAVLLEANATSPGIPDVSDDGLAGFLQRTDAFDAEAMTRALQAITDRYDERRERLAALLGRMRADIDASYRAAFDCGGWEGTVSAPVTPMFESGAVSHR